MQFKERFGEQWQSAQQPLISGAIQFATSLLWLALTGLLATTIILALKGGLSLPIESQQALLDAHQGDVIGLAYLFAFPLIIATLRYVSQRHRNHSFSDYMGLHPVDRITILRWLGALLIFGIVAVICAVICADIFARPKVPEWIQTTLNNTQQPWLLFAAIVFLAPVAEELVYRGYVLRAWSQTWLGATGATIAVSLVWAIVHLQYDLYDAVWIVLMGLLLSLSRIYSGSLIPAIVLHCSWNTAAVLYYTSQLAESSAL